MDDLIETGHCHEQNKRLLQWLQSLPEVQVIMDAEFEGKPINSQNLSDWKKSGFKAWQTTQSALDFMENSLSDDLPQGTPRLSRSIKVF